MDIEDIPTTHNISCEQLGLPKPLYLTLDRSQDNIFQDSSQSNAIFETMYQNANNEQKEIIDLVMCEIQYKDTGCNVFCLTAHAGCGETYIQTAIIHSLHSMNLKCPATAFS